MADATTTPIAEPVVFPTEPQEATATSLVTAAATETSSTAAVEKVENEADETTISPKARSQEEEEETEEVPPPLSLEGGEQHNNNTIITATATKASSGINIRKPKPEQPVNAWKRAKQERLVANATHVPSADLAEAAAKIQAEVEKNKRRAERFGVPYHAPDILAAGILSKGEYLRLMQQKEPGEVTGFDPTTEEEKAKQAKRAERFGAKTTTHDYETERMTVAGLSEGAMKLRKERRERASKFGKTDPIDIAIAKAARLAIIGPEVAIPSSSSAAAAGGAASSSSSGSGSGRGNKKNANRRSSTSAEAEEDGEEKQYSKLSSSSSSSRGGADDDDDGRRGGEDDGGHTRTDLDDVEGEDEEEGKTRTITTDHNNNNNKSGEGEQEAEEGEETETEAAAAASASSAPQEPEEPAVRRPDAIHVRAYQYLPASSSDFYAFFAPLRPAYIEWLNAVSVNVLFQDQGTAARALALFSEPVPVVPGVLPVPEGWRYCLKPLIKGKTDKYAPAGAETTIFLRYATNYDTKERASATKGPRAHGTFSRGGVFSKRAVKQELHAREILQAQIEDDEAMNLGGGGNSNSSGGRYNPRAIVGSGALERAMDVDAIVNSLDDDPSAAFHVASRITQLLSTTASHISGAFQRDATSTRRIITGFDDTVGEEEGGGGGGDGSGGGAKAIFRVTVEMGGKRQIRGALQGAIRERKMVREVGKPASKSQTAAGAAAEAEAGEVEEGKEVENTKNKKRKRGADEDDQNNNNDNEEEEKEGGEEEGDVKQEESADGGAAFATTISIGHALSNADKEEVELRQEAEAESVSVTTTTSSSLLAAPSASAQAEAALAAADALLNTVVNLEDM